MASKAKIIASATKKLKQKRILIDALFTDMQVHMWLDKVTAEYLWGALNARLGSCDTAKLLF